MNNNWTLKAILCYLAAKTLESQDIFNAAIISSSLLGGFFFTHGSGSSVLNRNNLKLFGSVL